MKKFKHLVNWLPEVYFLLSTIYYWMMTGTTINPIAIAILSLLLLQIVLRYKVSGIIIASVIILLNGYLVLALLSEFHEFPTIDAKAIKLLIGGSIYLTLNLSMAILMLVKYAKTKLTAPQATI